MKNRFATLSDEEKRMLFAHASEQTKLTVQVIEKDWWVTLVLRLLSQSSCSDHISFKGGTSLRMPTSRWTIPSLVSTTPVGASV